MLQALLCDELEKARQQKEQAKKDVRAATRAEKNAMKRRNRLLKATLQGHCAALPLSRWQAAKGLSGEDLKLILAAKSAAVEKEPKLGSYRTLPLARGDAAASVISCDILMVLGFMVLDFLAQASPWPDGLPTETELRDCAALLVAKVDLHCCTLGELRAQIANQCGVAVEALGVVTEEVNELIKEVVEAHFAKKAGAPPVSGDAGLGEEVDKPRRAYLVTFADTQRETSSDGRKLVAPGAYSRCEVRGFIQGAVTATQSNRTQPLGLTYMSVFQERHASGRIHYHAALLGDKCFRFLTVKRHLLQAHGLASHWSEARWREVDLWPIVVRENIAPDEICGEKLMAYAKRCGGHAMVEYCFANWDKLPGVVAKSWQVEKVETFVETAQKSRLGLLQEALQQDCVCQGQWGSFANTILSQNGNEGKSFLLRPLPQIYGEAGVFVTPPKSAFPLLGLEKARAVWLDDWRFNEDLVSWGVQLLWFEGASFIIGRPQNMYSGHLRYAKDDPIFVTTLQTDLISLKGKLKQGDLEMMLKRLKVYEFKHKVSIPGHVAKGCGCCFARFLLEGPGASADPRKRPATSSGRTPEGKRLQCLAWNVGQVCEYLRALELEHVVAAFKENGVDGRFLASLSEGDLVAELGLKPLQARLLEGTKRCTDGWSLEDWPAPREQLAALRRKVRNLQRRKRRLEAAGGAAEVAAPAQAPAVRLAQLVYVLANHSQATAAHFLRGWGRRRQQNGVVPADRQLADLLEDVVWATRSQTGEAVSSFSVKDQVLAGRYVVEDKLFHWVFAQNTEHGVAPSRSQLVEQALMCVPARMCAEAQGKLRALLSGKPRAQRKWLARLRARWGARLGALKPQNVLPVEQMQMKAVLRACSSADKASLSQLRCRVSYLASIADDVSVQPLLPQVIIGNKRTFTLTALKGAEPDRPGNVFYWRAETAWNTHAAMRRYIVLLAKQLGELAHCRYVILLVYCARVHIHTSIRRVAKLKGIRLVFIPTFMTPWLQPCDSHFFSCFKHALRENWRASKSRVAGGVVNTETWLSVISQTIEAAVQKCWRHAFLSDGILLRQQSVSKELCRAIGLGEPPVVGSDPPTAAEVASMMPGRSREDFLEYVKWTSQSRPAVKPRRHCQLHLCGVTAAAPLLRWIDVARVCGKRRVA
ncbi:unnamed protein product [Effrenium voratum]|nr:unnamed protein product [Effrenium voratum]